MPVIINNYFTITIQSFTFVGSCTSGTSSLNFGSLSAGAIAANDILVYFDYATGSGGDPSAVTPSGFTNHDDESGGTNGRVMISTKKSDGTEGAVTGMNGNDNNAKIGFVFRPVAAYTSISANDITSNGTAGDPTAINIDPSAETVAVIVLGATSSSASPEFTTASPAFTATVSNDKIIAGYRIYNTAPTDHDMDTDDGGGSFNTIHGLYLKTI